jgi:hypothetical protein
LTSHVPDIWPQATGPSHWFTLRHPPGWDLQSDGNVLHLIASDQRITLTLHCLWLSPGDSRRESGNLHLERIFPVRRNVHEIPPLRLPIQNIGQEGEAVLGPETPWWRRVITSTEWRRWRVWAIQNESLYVIAIYLQDTEFDPEGDTLVRLILESLEFADPLADPAPVFARRVVELARQQFPGVDCHLDENQQLRIGEATININHLYRVYSGAPDQFREIVQPALRTMLDVQNWDDDRLAPSLDSVRDRIMPMLCQESVFERQFQDFVSQSWVGGLVILYVVDEPEAYWYIRSELFDSWEIEPEELHAIALQNLDRYFTENEMEMVVSGHEDGPQLLLPNRPDSYNAARLLSDTFRATLVRTLGQEVIVGVPNRDFFVAVSQSAGDMIPQIRQRVLDDFARMDHPLSQRLLLVSSDGVSEYCDEV